MDMRSVSMRLQIYEELETFGFWAEAAAPATLRAIEAVQ